LIKNILNNRKKYIAICAVIITLIISVGLIMMLSGTRIHKGITIDGIDVKGLKMSEAKSTVENKLRERYSQEKIMLQYEGGIWEYDFDQINIEFDIDEAIAKAYKVGRSGNVFAKINNILKAMLKGREISTKVVYNKDRINEIVTKAKKDIDIKGRNASIKYNHGAIELVKEKKGRILDLNKNILNIEKRIISRNFESINLVVEETEPKIISDNLKDINVSIGTFKTVFKSGDSNRKFNIELASGKLNEIILLPGEIFSMNKVLGPRTEKNGYRQAPVIFKNELVNGTGGGVCQVTTTLYNAVLLSKLKVNQRRHHSMPLLYVEPGLDATIAEDYIDFKFTNSKDYPICICSWVDRNTINVTILGSKHEKIEKVIIKSRVIEEYNPDGEEIVFDENLLEGERIVLREGRKGLKVVVNRETYDNNNNLIHNERISEDIYLPLKPKIKVYAGGTLNGDWESTE